MELINTLTQEIIGLSELKKLYPNTAFPNNLKDADLSDFNVSVVITEEAPNYNPEIEKLELSEPTLINGQYKRTWSILPKPIEIPTSVTMRQARLALNSQGLLDDIETNISNMSKEVQIEWEYATKVERNSPLVSQLAETLNLSESDLDNLFTLAGNL